METLPFETIGRFQLEAPVGQGGFGIVYRANDPVLDRPVAIKLLAPHLGADVSANSRFQREASLIASLKHTHIASIYEFGEHESRPYIAMEWIEGRTLKQLLADEGALDQERAISLLRQLADALDYAHANGVIHRDLKPSNIIVNSLDQVTVVDFGLAWVADAPSLTVSGSMLGTPLYMSPEQIQGAAVDGRADQYSLAIILYEMLSGVQPFQSDSTQALYHQQMFAEPPPITEHNPALPGHVEEALSKALEKSAESRYPTVSDFHVAVATKSTTRRTGKKRISRPAIALLLVGLIALFGWVFQEELRGSIPGLQADAPEVISAWGLPNGGPNQSRFVDVPLDEVSFTLQTESYWEEDSVGSMVVGRERIALAQWEWLSVRDWSDGEEVWATSLGAPLSAEPILLSDWEQAYLFVAIEDGGLQALSVDDRQLLWQIGSAEFDGTITHITHNANNEVIALTDTNALYKINIYESESEHIVDLPEDAEILTAPTATNAAIFLVDQSGEVLAVDVASGRLDWQAATDAAPSTPAVVIGNDAANGIVVGNDNGVVQALSLLNGTETWQVETGASVLGFASDWWRVFVSSENGQLHAFEGASGETLWSVEIGAGLVGAPIITQDSVVVATDAGDVRFYSAETGVESDAQRIEIGDEVVAAPIMVEDWLYVQTSAVLYIYTP